MTEPTSDLQYRVERPVTDPLELEADAPLTEDEAGYVEAARAASTYPASSSVSGASASSSSGSVTGRSTRYWRSLVGSVMIGRIGGARRDSGDHPVYRRRQLHPFSASGKSSVPADRGPFAPPARSGSTTAPSGAATWHQGKGVDETPAGPCLACLIAGGSRSPRLRHLTLRQQEEIGPRTPCSQIGPVKSSWRCDRPGCRGT